MARYNNGYMGPFSGKLGPAVGTSWKGISILRSLPAAKKNRTSTQEQTEHKARFAQAMGFSREQTTLWFPVK